MPDKYKNKYRPQPVYKIGIIDGMLLILLQFAQKTENIILVKL